MLRRVAIVRTDVLKEFSASIIRITRIGELRTTLAVTGNRRTLQRNTKLLVTDNVVPTSPVLLTLMMGALYSSETLALTRTTRSNIPEDGIVFVLLLLSKPCACVAAVHKINFVYRLAQIRESGLQDRLRQHYITSNRLKAEPSTVAVGLLAIAPILVVFAAGNVMSVFVLLIERIIRGNVFKFWPDIRRKYNKEYLQFVRNHRYSRILLVPRRQPLRIR
jgi:hypothetical protein